MYIYIYICEFVIKILQCITIIFKFDLNNEYFDTIVMSLSHSLHSIQICEFRVNEK